MAERERMEATDGGSDGTKTVDASGRGEVGAVKKVVVVFRATGDAPVLKQSRFKVEVRGTFARIVQLLCKQIQKDSVLVYLDSSFLPSMDDSIADLVEVRIAGSIVWFVFVVSTGVVGLRSRPDRAFRLRHARSHAGIRFARHVGVELFAHACMGLTSMVGIRLPALCPVSTWFVSSKGTLVRAWVVSNPSFSLFLLLCRPSKRICVVPPSFSHALGVVSHPPFRSLSLRDSKGTR